MDNALKRKLAEWDEKLQLEPDEAGEEAAGEGEGEAALAPPQPRLRGVQL